MLIACVLLCVKGACSVSSAEIEAQYQRNPQGCMSFTINGQPYEINFSSKSYNM